MIKPFSSDIGYLEYWAQSAKLSSAREWLYVSLDLLLPSERWRQLHRDFG